MAPSVGLRALSTATEAASSQPRTVASLPGGGVSDTPRSAAARSCANNSERATLGVAGADEPFARELGADAIEQVAGGDGDLLAGFVVTRRRGWRGGRLHAADLAPGFIAAALATSADWMRSRLCSSACCCVSPGRQQREHAIRVGGATGGEPGARGAQAEFGAVAAGGFGRQPLVEGGGAGMVAGARELLRRDRRSVVRHGAAWSGSPRAARPVADDDQERQWSYAELS